MEEKTIKVLKVEPGEVPSVTTLENNLDALQKAVSIGCDQQGLIEIIPIADNVVILCNEEGKLIGLEGNRRLGNDILVGVFYALGTDDEGNLCSLTEEQIVFYNNVFFFPETFSKEEVENTIFYKITDFPEG